MNICVLKRILHKKKGNFPQRNFVKCIPLYNIKQVHLYELVVAKKYLTSLLILSVCLISWMSSSDGIPANYKKMFVVTCISCCPRAQCQAGPGRRSQAASSGSLLWKNLHFARFKHLHEMAKASREVL